MYAIRSYYGRTDDFSGKDDSFGSKPFDGFFDVFNTHRNVVKDTVSKFVHPSRNNTGAPPVVRIGLIDEDSRVPSYNFV